MKHIALAAMIAGTVALNAVGASPAWLWSPTDRESMQGWSEARNAEVANRDGMLEFKVTGKDCQLLLPSVRLDPAQYDRLAIYYSSGNFDGQALSGQLYFANADHSFTDADHIRLNLQADQKDAVLTASMPGGWTKGGTVTSLRFDPVDQTPGNVVIRGLVLYNSADFPQPPPLAAAKAGNDSKLVLWDGNFDAWSNPANMTATEKDGHLLMTLNAKDARMSWQGKAFAPQDYTWLAITAKATGFADGMSSGQLYYINSNHGVDGKFFFVLPNFPTDGTEYTRMIELRRNLRHGTVEDFEQGGAITGFRYDPTDSAPGEIEVSKFELIGPRVY